MNKSDKERLLDAFAAAARDRVVHRDGYTFDSSELIENKSTPITEEALMEMGFKDGVYELYLTLRYNKANGEGKLRWNAIYGVAFVGQDDYCGFPGCLTIQDLKTLIRLLGGEE